MVLPSSDTRHVPPVVATKASTDPVAAPVPVAGPTSSTVSPTVPFLPFVAVRYSKRSASPVLLVPVAFVTVTSTTPVPGGEIAFISLGFSGSIVNPAALAAPNLTAETSRKFVPVMVTAVPPAAGPLLGATAVIRGRGPNAHTAPA